MELGLTKSRGLSSDIVDDKQALLVDGRIIYIFVETVASCLVSPVDHSVDVYWSEAAGKKSKVGLASGCSNALHGPTLILSNIR